MFSFILIKILLSLICCQFNMSMNVSFCLLETGLKPVSTFPLVSGVQTYNLFSFLANVFLIFFLSKKKVVAVQRLYLKKPFVNLKTQRTYSLLRVQK